MTRVGPARRMAIYLGLAAVATSLFLPVHGAEHRLVIHVGRPVVVHGQLYPAGEISVRQVGAFSPTSTLNEIRVGGEGLGLLLAEVRQGSPRASADALEFEVDHRGNMVLVGFSYRGQNSRELFRPRRVAAGSRERTRAGAITRTPPEVAVK